MLYAESRDLLPSHDPVYVADFSLSEIIARLPARSGALLAADIAIWSRLARLFRALNGEQHSVVVPAFSGRLFDDAQHPLLARLTLADAPLARMLTLLGRTPQGQRIDYADLAVRQLGGIYEGLLEHQAIAVAVEEMALAKGPKDKAPVIVPRNALGERRALEVYAPGAVYLSNDNGERHAAGTYYTPEPVVRYLVEETLGPLVAGKTAEQILALRVLDPAMGSAHFLVAAVDYLARAALAAREDAPRKGKRAIPPASAPVEGFDDGDVLELKRRIAEQCIYGVDINEAAVELGKLSLWLVTAAKDRPLTFLDLHLRAGNSLIGLAPGEMEAAVTQAPGAKPGARPRQATRHRAPSLPGIAAAPDAAQASLWNETAFTQAMFKVVGAARVVDLMPSDSVEAVRSKQHVAGEIEREMRRYREAADLAVSLRLGASVAPAEYRAALNTLLDRVGIPLGDATLDHALAHARQAHARHAIFHWELEFPEVFRDGNGQPLGASAGFDAIVGNPPYVSVTTLRASDPAAWAYYPQVFTSAAQGKYDLYVAFVERGLALLRGQGRLAYILPNKWLTSDFGAPLRALLAERRAVSALVDFGAYQVFPSVSNYTCLLFAGIAPSDTLAVTRRTQTEGEIALPPPAQSALWAHGAVAASALGSDAWNLTVGGAQTILAKWSDWLTLKQVGTVFEGVTSGANPVFILTELARAGEVVTCYAPALGRTVKLDAALLHPVVQGRDIQPYLSDDHDNRLLSPYRLAEGRATLLPADELAARYPLTWAYLDDETIRATLEAREHGRFRGRSDWYGFGYPRNMTLLPEPKLVLPDVAARGRVAWDADGHDIVDTAYGIAPRAESPYAPGFILAALNSPILSFFLRQRGANNLRGGYFRMKTAYLNPFPLPPLAEASAASAASEMSEARARQAQSASQRVRAALRAGEPPTSVAAELTRLPDATRLVVADVVVALAEQVTTLATREQAAWRRFAELAATLRPDILARGDQRLRFERAHELATPDELIATGAQAGAPLTASELATLRGAHGEAHAALAASQSERAAIVTVIERLLYHLYELSDAEVATVERREVSAGGATPAAAEVASAQGSRDAGDAVSYQNQRKQRKVVGAGEQHLPQEARDAMRIVSKGGQPAMLARCVAQTLSDPYSDVTAMNAAMGYVANSSVGPHYLNTAVLAGLLTETRHGWPRPTRAGRLLALGAVAETQAGDHGDHGDHGEAAIWDALLTLPAYRRYLEYKILTIAQRNRQHSEAQQRDVLERTYAAFPAFRVRAESVEQMLALDELTPGRAVTVLRNPPTLEPLGWEAVDHWMKAQNLGPGRSELSRAEEIAATLARAANLPLTVRSEWLEPAQLLALLLLIAARQRGQGVTLSGKADGKAGGAQVIARAVEALRQCGLDIRSEQRGQMAVAALIPAINLRIASVEALDALMTIGAPDVAPVARTVAASLRAELRVGLDDEARAEIAPGELGNRCAEATFAGVGEFVGAAAADEMLPVVSRIIVGAPLPLASDLSRLGQEYRFLGEAMRGHGVRGWRGGVAALLSPWSVQPQQPQRAPVEELADNPHLALLYLIAADMGDRAPALKRRDSGWYLGEAPLVHALDARLRALSYAVWDEGYRADERRAQTLGVALVEQGLRLGVLTASSDPTFPLEAPSAYGYYEAIDLLNVTPARRREEAAR